MNRRSFFQSIVGVFIAAHAKLKAKPLVEKAIAHIPKNGPLVSEPDIDRLMEAVGSGKTVEFDGWRVIWTGWKAAQNSIDVSSQWVFLPIDTPENPSTGPFAERMGFYISNPGYEGLMRRGEAFNITYRWQQIGFGIDLLLMHAEADQVLKNAQRVTGRLALETMRGGVRFFKPTHPHWTFDWAYSKLSWQSRFYLCPEKYMATELGVGRGHPAFFEVGNQLFRELYGITDQSWKAIHEF